MLCTLTDDGQTTGRLVDSDLLDLTFYFFLLFRSEQSYTYGNLWQCHPDHYTGCLLCQRLPLPSARNRANFAVNAFLFICCSQIPPPGSQRSFQYSPKKRAFQKSAIASTGKLPAPPWMICLQRGESNHTGTVSSVRVGNVPQEEKT